MHVPTTATAPLASPLAGRVDAGSRGARRARTAARLAFAVLPTLVATTACASRPRPPHAATSPRRFGVATAEDLRWCAGLSIYECLERERPMFVRHRAGTVTVFLDGVLWGPVAGLRDIPAVEVREVRLLTRIEATTAHGSMSGGAALEVTLRRSVP